MIKKKRRILVTGNGRSGTLTMSRSLKTLGLDVPHEYCGEDGTVSLFFYNPKMQDYPYFPDAPPKGKNAHVGQHMKDFKFEYRVRVIRHPLKCIASLTAILPRDILDWYVRNGVVSGGGLATGPTRLHLCMRVYYHVNEALNRQMFDLTYKLEAVDKAWPKIVYMLGYSTKDHPWPDYHSHPSTFPRNKPVSWERLDEVDKELSDKIWQQAKSYGYRRAPK